jgi:5-methylcytosine-specific restriction endonuclease McrBC regulatory subunit McrC
MSLADALFQLLIFFYCYKQRSEIYRVSQLYLIYPQLSTYHESWIAYLACVDRMTILLCLKRNHLLLKQGKVWNSNE